MPSNSAAWLVAEKAKPFEVRPAPYTPPGEHEIVIKNAAVAVNPADWIMQDQLTPLPLHYPTILGQDVAGVVVEVGNSVTRFRVGDRVLGHASAMWTQRSCEAAFQEYTVVADNMSSPIPSAITFEAAAVIPLGLSTAACGLYQKTHLALDFPTASPNPKPGQVLLVWGGASSVGSNGIQLGVCSGYEVIAVASKRNFDYVKRIGASQAFDYASPTIVEDLVDAVKGKTVVGVLECIASTEVVEKCAKVLRRAEGRKVMATVRAFPEELPGGVQTKCIWGGTLKNNEVGKAVFEDFLPQALADSTFVPAPEPVVVGNGLEAIQSGLEAQKNGMSAKKVVITLL